jgi:membrane protein YdbS with pleckstrin-like domain
MRPGRQRQRVNDFALYIGISTAVILYLSVGSLAGLSFAWIILPIQGALVFGYFIATSRNVWSGPFWSLSALFLLIHIAVVPIIYREYNAYEDHGMAYLIALGSFLEPLVFSVVRDLMLPRPNPE